MVDQEISAVRISVLGPLRAWVDGQPVDLGGPKQRSVLLRLVLAHGEVVSVDRLIEDLWAGEPPPKALAALQAYISHLRRVLEPGRARRAAARVIVSAAPGYCLRLPDTGVDVWELEAAITAAEQAADRAALLEQLVASWSGEPYAEVRDALWAAPEVARLAELRRHHRGDAAAQRTGNDAPRCGRWSRCCVPSRTGGRAALLAAATLPARASDRRPGCAAQHPDT
jgi:DNA-binding SARP family transcriptional activator